MDTIDIDIYWYTDIYLVHTRDVWENISHGRFMKDRFNKPINLIEKSNTCWIQDV